MALFYTGKGDKGKSYIGKKKYQKDLPILVTLGELDELNSLIGLVRSNIKRKKLQLELKKVQETLFIIQARVALIMYPKFKAPKLKKEKITELEKEIKSIEKKINPKRGFIISGINSDSAWFDYLRTVARRTERALVGLNKKHQLTPEILAYINRLSSYFYALARFEASRRGLKESNPSYK